MAFFSHFQYGFRAPRSTADLLIVVSLNRSEATRAVALDIFSLSTGFGMLVFFKNFWQVF